MIEYRNNCVMCPQGCVECGRKKQKTLICDDCGDEVQDLYYGDDGQQYCDTCIKYHVEKVVLE